MEEWKAVPDFTGLYEVSDQGRVRSVRLNRRTRPGLILKPRPSNQGYLRVRLYRPGGFRGDFLIHRLVATAFIGAPAPDLVVNHKNGIRVDNRAENLEWVTRSENQLHATRVLGHHGTFGEIHPQSKLTESEVKEIRRLYREGGLSQQALADRFGLNQNTVWKVVNRKTWGHVPDESRVA